MFEFDDEKLGKIKIVNVTEARSSIANIMQDRETSYVITKNNRPVRVIVNFEVFRRLQGSSGSRAVKGVEVRDSIRGLLESREQDLRNSESRSVKTVLQPGGIEREPSPLMTDGSASQGEDARTGSSVTDKEPAVPASTEPPPSDDYFERFRKLYSSPVAQKADKGALSPTPRVESEDIFPEPPVEAEPIATRRPSIEKGPRHSSGLETPSIQDLLAELEKERLSDEVEGDESIHPDKVKDFLHKMSK